MVTSTFIFDVNKPLEQVHKLECLKYSVIHPLLLLNLIEKQPQMKMTNIVAFNGDYPSPLLIGRLKEVLIFRTVALPQWLKISGHQQKLFQEFNKYFSSKVEEMTLHSSLLHHDTTLDFTADAVNIVADWFYSFHILSGSSVHFSKKFNIPFWSKVTTTR